MEKTGIVPLHEAVAKAVLALEKGGVIIYPTDTLYGIGADGTSKIAVARVNEIKGREGKPFSLMFSCIESISKWAEIGDRERKALGELFPGPFTAILAKKAGMELAIKGNTVGVRIPGNEFCLALAKKFAKPIISTSANISGEDAPSKPWEIGKTILEKVDLFVDGGECKLGQGSTVIDFVNKKIVREGCGLEKAKKVLGML